MKLYLMRHGDALSSEDDPERGLTNDGKLKIELLAKHLNKQNLNFDCVCHSFKKRAKETAEIMSKNISPDIVPALIQNITPNDDPKLLAAEIKNWNEDTLVTSHLPFVPNLITLLTGQDVYTSGISFETGTIVCLEKNDTDWSIRWATSPSEIA